MDTLPQLADLRRSYQKGQLRRADLHPSPLEQFGLWFKEALHSAPEGSEPYALSLATASAQGRPSVRTVLLRDVSEAGLTFYSNYQSHKGQDLSANPQAEMLFFWPHLERQVRAYGPVYRLSEADSDAYFQRRPYESQLAAWASQPQSGVIASRQELEACLSRLQERYPAAPIPRPPFWGGYSLQPQEWEFWQGRVGRLHDRFRYRPSGEGWVAERLAP